MKALEMIHHDAFVLGGTIVSFEHRNLASHETDEVPFTATDLSSLAFQLSQLMVTLLASSRTSFKISSGLVVMSSMQERLLQERSPHDGVLLADAQIFQTNLYSLWNLCLAMCQAIW